MTFRRILTRIALTVEFLVLVSPAALGAVTEGGGSFFEAQALMQSGKWAEAVIILRSVLEERPRFLSAQIQLASALVRLERRGEALADLNRWISASQGVPREQLITRVKTLSRIFLGQKTLQTYLDGVQLLNDGKKVEARSKFSQILDKERDNFEVLLRLGQTFVLEADYDSASERLRSAVQLNPYEPTGHLWLGRALFNKGETQLGLEELKAGKAGLPDSEVASVWLAEALSATGDRQAAVSLLEKDFTSDPTRVLTLVYLGKERIESFPFDLPQMQRAKKNLESARELLKEPKALGISPSEGELSVHIFQSEDLMKEIANLLHSADDRLTRMGVK